MDDIELFPEGINTKISEDGDNISVGQKHRICMARAILQDKPIVLIDEATSSIDKETETNIKNNLKKYFKDKIVVIITHSDNFVDDNATRLYVENFKIKVVQDI